MDMKETEMRELCLDLMSCSEAAFLSTINKDGYPNIRAMSNLRNTEQYARLIPYFMNHKNDFMILFSTNTSSEKVSHVRKNPKISVYYKKPGKFQGVTFIGEVEIVKDQNVFLAIWDDNMKKYYPLGMNDPDHTVLRMYPKKVKGWNSEKFTTFSFNIR